MSIVAQERETYEAAWTVGGYEEYSPGEVYLPLFLDMVRPPDGQTTVLDAGSGSGKGALALRYAGFQVTLADITNAGLVEEARSFPFYEVCLWQSLVGKVGYQPGGKFDYVYCCDVLEHVPPVFTMLVVSRLLEVARLGVFLSISLVPDQFGVRIGKPLHQTVQPFLEWRDQLNALGRVRESRDLLHCGIYYVERS